MLLTDYRDALLRYDLPSFIGKTLETCDPAATYQDNWHIDLIAEYLEAARRGQIHRLIINMPPRSLKSISVSVAWPAWLLGHDPRSRIIAASYAQSLAVKHSLDTRAVMGAKWYRRNFPEVKLARDQNEKHKFMTTKRGFRFATSVGGSLTGEGGNFLIIDDPVSPMHAMTKHWRDHVNRWFDSTFASRLDDKKNGVIVLVMQRLHEHDLTGHLLSKGGWEHLNLPAIAMRNEIHDVGIAYHERATGEPLHPDRESMEFIERARTELGSQAFSAQYQQQPLPEEGGMVNPKWIVRYDAPPDAPTRRVQSWDTAIKSGKQHDASVCLTFAEMDGKSFLVDVQVMRLEYPDLKRRVLQLAEQWKPDAILIEDRASGQQLLQDLRRETHLPLIPTNPKQDKVTRLAAISAMIEAGRLALPRQARWLAEFEQELFTFPGSAHDDQVDALIHYFDWLRRGIWERLSLRRI